MKAFTLVEVLLSVAILAIISAAVITVMQVGWLSYDGNIAQVSIQQNARLAMQRMVKELRQSTQQDIPSDLSSITFDTLSLNSVEYYLDGGANSALREYPSGTTQILGNYITDLSFCCSHDAGICDDDCSGPDWLEIIVSSGTSSKGRDYSFSLKEQVVPRNE